MGNTITCPSCFQQLHVAEAQWHQQISCPHCRHVFRPDDMQIQAASPPPPPASRPGDEFVQEEPPSSWEPAHLRADSRWPERSRFLIQPSRTRGLAVATIIMLGLVMVTDVALMPVEITYTRFIDLLIRNPAPEPQDMEAGRRLEQILSLAGVAQLLLTIATAAVFLTWLARSYGNLTALGAQGLNYSPGWAVVYFFIPILNLFRPFQVMQETWKGSDPEYAFAQSLSWKRAPGSALVGFWWMFWLISSVAGQVSSRINLGEKPTLEALKIGSVAAVIGSMASLVAGGFLIFVIRGITARQEEKFQAQQGGQPDLDRDAEPA